MLESFESINNWNQLNLRKKSKVLIVEDSPTLTHVITRLLVNEYELYSSDNADMGLKLCEKYMPDVIVLDINLNGPITGLDLLQTIKNDETLSFIPVLMMSAISHFEIIEDALRYGANDYLVKPFEAAQLQDKITKLLLYSSEIKDKSFKERALAFSSTKANKKWLIQKINEMIDASIQNNQDLNIDEMAKLLYISQSTIGRFVKKEFGVTTANYVVIRKLEKARLMLAMHKDAMVKEVAQATGFNSVSYMCKCFKDRFGCTPQEFQKREISQTSTTH